MKEAKLNIIKASAGAGKTYRLIYEYLEILLQKSPHFFRNILAVTFTNKATSEMKSRILKELNLLANGDESAYLHELQNNLNLSVDKIRNKSKWALNYILHGYTWFSIETIDSFFQKLIRSFSRELGIWGGYNLELDSTKVQEEAVDRLISKIGENSKIKQWLLDYITEKIEGGESWNFKTTLQDFTNEIQKELLLNRKTELEEAVHDFGKFFSLISNLERDSYEKICSLGQKGLSIIENKGLLIEDFAGKSRSSAAVFDKLAKNGPLKELPKTFYNGLESAEKWVSAKSPNRDLILRLANNELIPLFNEILHINKEYFSALVIKQNLFALGLVTQIQQEIDNVCMDKNLFLINHTNPFIHKIIDANDTPFIYEKIGSVYYNFFIDEFQDTSVLQWSNFKPLISNSISMANNCLLVGDVKQSIYRWRNSNWEILGDKIYKEYPQEILNEQVLETNWRSTSDVINFNNVFFKGFCELIDSKNDFLSLGYTPLTNLYSDVEQKVSPKNNDERGFIENTFYDKKQVVENEKYYDNWLIEKLNQLFDSGFNPSDVVFLIRKKDEGVKLAEFLIEINQHQLCSRSFQVISNESLYLSSSHVIRLLINTLRFIQNINDLLVLTTLVVEYASLKESEDNLTFDFKETRLSQEKLLKYLPENFMQFIEVVSNRSLNDIIEQIISYFSLDQYMEGRAYLDSFLDYFSENTKNENNNIGSFLSLWENEGKNQSISASEGVNAMRIMTIHKSKGLEFPVVIMPFCDWDINPRSSQFLWFQPTIEPFNQFPLLPVKYGKSLEASNFSDLYFEEKYRSLVDNANLLYVAFTRAKNALLTLSVVPERSTGAISSIMHENLKKLASRNGAEENENVFSSGELISQFKDYKEVNPIHADITGKKAEIGFHSWKVKRAKEWEESSLLANHRILGIFWHSVLELIETTNDISSAVLKLKREGKLVHISSEKLEKDLNQLFKENELAREWFSGNYTVLNEAEILLENGSTKRPDRIMLRDEKAVIVDYKTSAFEPEHEKQVKNYMKLIQSMGYNDVDGYVWYLAENNIKKVE